MTDYLQGVKAGDSLALCHMFFPEFKHKSKRFQLGQLATEEQFEVCRRDTDSLLIYFRSLPIEVLKDKLVLYRNQCRVPQIRWL